MKYIRDWIEKLKDPDRDPYERRYRLLALVSIASLFLWWILAALISFNPVRFVFFGLTDMVFVGFYLYALHTGRVQLIAVISASGLIFAMIPIAFLFNGGIYAGAPNWFLIALVFVIATVRGRFKIILVASDAVITLCMFTFSALYPDRVTGFSGQSGLINSIAALVITAVIVCSMLYFQTYMTNQERIIFRAQRNEIEELNRSQNRFFSSMSHEIRTPINTIIGLNEMNMRDTGISEEMRANNRNIQGASRMLLALINDILDMSKMESGKMDIVPVAYDAGALLSEVVNMIWSRAEEKGLKFQVDVDETLPSQLYGDEVRIKQVLINLLNNAVKYTKEGSVRLSVQCERLSEKEAHITWRVEDTGMGIKKEAIPDLFDAFKRVDEEKNRNIEGTGLGLSIVKQIVDLMGGEILVDSIYTKGSTFTFSVTQEVLGDDTVGNISLHTKRFAGEETAYRASFEAPTASLLIVDDNELNLQVESKLLQATKIETDLAHSGKECLEMTARKKYDAIFMDHLMPEMDGIEALKEIRAQRGGLNRETPVIVLTANAGSENQALYTANGFDGYLLKPVSGDQLESALLNALPQEKILRTGTATVTGNRQVISGHARRRRSIAVSCETCADLPEALADKYNISVIKYYVHTGDGTFRDNLDIDADGLMEYLDDVTHFAKSEVPSVKDYERFFAARLSGAQHVVHIALGSKASKGYETACEAAKSFENITVVDSGTISSSTGLLVLFAAYRSEHVESVENLLEEIEIVKREIRMSFVVDNTALFARGGRMSETVHSVIEALMARPVMQMKRDGLGVGKVFFGARERYRQNYIRYTLRHAKRIDTSLLFITYVGLTEEELASIRAQVEEKVPFERIIFQRASSAIAVNCGRGTFGLLYRELSGEDEETRLLYDFLPVNAGMEEEADAAAIEEPEEDTATVEEPEAEPGAEEEEGTALQQLYASSGIFNYEEAMKYLGDEDLMEKTLQQFYESIPEKAEEIERYFTEEDLENYAIKVHALKSSARLVGAEDLSEAARELERLSKEGELQSVREKTPKLLATYRELIPLLEPYFGTLQAEEADEDLPEIDREELQELYEAIGEFAEIYDTDGILGMLRQTEGCAIPESERERIARIRESVTNSDWTALQAALARDVV